MRQNIWKFAQMSFHEPKPFNPVIKLICVNKFLQTLAMSISLQTITTTLALRGVRICRCYWCVSHFHNVCCVQACTGGGCRLSSATTARTQESPPSGVQPPNITALSSSQLLITWAVPLQPNGMLCYVITMKLLLATCKMFKLKCANII